MKGILQGRTQVFQIAQAAGTTSGRRSFNLDFDSEFKTVRGFYLVRPKGTDYIEIGIKDANGIYVLDPVTSEHITYKNFSPPIKDRYFEGSPFVAAGTQGKLEIENFAALTADHEFHLICYLDNNPIDYERETALKK